MLLSELTNAIEQFIIMYVHRSEAHFTYIYVHHTNVFEVDTIYKTLTGSSSSMACPVIIADDLIPPCCPVCARVQ